MMMPCSRAKTTASMDFWLVCPSRIRMCFSSGLGFTMLAKCFNQSGEVSVSIHPDAHTLTIEPVGAPFIRLSFMRFLLNTNIGGRLVPAALAAHMTVTLLPRSPLTALPTLRSPFAARIRCGVCTVETPVSSAFQILPGFYFTTVFHILHSSSLHCL